VEHIVRYLRLAGGFSLAASGVSLMLLPEAFPYFVSFVYGTILLWTADAFFELRNEYRRWLFAPVVVAFAAIVLFSEQFVFVRSPLGLSTLTADADYDPGTVIGGINWDSRFGQVRVTIPNGSDRDYTDLDLLIKPKEPVFEAGPMKQYPNLSIVRVFPNLTFDLQLFHAKTHARTELPIIWFISTGGFRVRADRLYAHSQIEVVLAVVTVNNEALKRNPDQLAGPWGFGGDQYWFRWQSFPVPDDMFGKRPIPTLVTIKGHYTSFYRRIYVAKTQVPFNPDLEAMRRLLGQASPAIQEENTAGPMYVGVVIYTIIIMFAPLALLVLWVMGVPCGVWRIHEPPLPGYGVESAPVGAVREPPVLGRDKAGS
jgi:hypothetical protein